MNSRPELPQKQNISPFRSFACAARGIGIAFLRERNLRIHSVAGTAALYLSRFFALSRGEMAALLLCIGLVLAVELLNTALEYVVDLHAHGEYSALARACKDVAAGAVLVCAALSLLVALALFWRPDCFGAVGRDLLDHPLPWTLAAAAAVLWIVLPHPVRPNPPS